MIKKIFIGLAVVIVVLIVIGFFLPGKMEVSRSISINASAEAVFEEFNDLKKWQEWQYWNTLDPESKITYGDITSGAGATYSWDGPKLGKGNVKILESIPNERVNSEIDFTGSGKAQGVYTVEPEGEGTKASMNFSFDNGMNPIGRWFSVFMKGEIEKAFDYGLNKIKERAEAKPKFTVDITEVNTPVVSYVGITSTSLNTNDMDALNAVMAKSFTQIANDLNKAKVQITGPALGIVTRWDDATHEMDLISGFPVDDNAKVPAKYTIQQIAAGKAVKAIHRGDYAHTDKTHEQIGRYIEMKKLLITGEPWEFYLTDPMIEKDTAAWVTEVYYPVQ